MLEQPITERGDLNPRMVSLDGAMETGLLILETEGSCRLGCLHCNIDLAENHRKVGEQPDFLSSIENYAASAPPGSNLILKNAAGGLRKQELVLVQRAVELGLFTTITTEGITVPTYFQDRIVDLNSRFPGRVGYTVSLDGSNDSVHRLLRVNIPFDKVVSFITNQTERDVYVETNFVAHDGNIQDFEKYMGFVIGLGVSRVNVLPLQEIGAAARNSLRPPNLIEMVDVLIDAYETGSEAVKRAMERTIGGYFHDLKTGAEKTACEGCPAGSKHMIMVDSRGDIYPCNSLREPQYRQGNIKGLPLSEVHESERFRGIAGQLMSSVDVDSPLNFGCPRVIEKSPQSYRDALNYLNSRLESSGVDLGYVKKKLANGSVLQGHGKRVCFARTF